MPLRAGRSICQTTSQLLQTQPNILPRYVAPVASRSLATSTVPSSKSKPKFKYNYKPNYKLNSWYKRIRISPTEGHHPQFLPAEPPAEHVESLASELGPERQSLEHPAVKPCPARPTPLRDQLVYLLSAPTNADTISLLAQLKSDPPTLPRDTCILAEALVHHAYISDALELLADTRARGVTIPLPYYEPIVFRLVSKNRWQDVLALLEPIQSLTATPNEAARNKLTTRMCEWRVRACAELGDVTGMERALGKFPQDVPRRAWGVAERAFIKNSDLETATRIRRALQIEGGGEEGDGGRTDRKLEEEKLVEIAQLLTRQPGDRGRSGDPLGSLQEMQISLVDDTNDPTYLITSHPTPSSPNTHPAHRFKPTARLAVLCVKTLIRDGRIKEAASVVNSMCKGVSVSQDLSASSTKTSTSEPPSSSKKPSLSKIFSPVRPNIFVFNELLRGILGTHGLEGMLLLLEIMQEQGVIPNAETGVLLLKHLDRELAWRPHLLIDTLVDMTKPIPKLSASEHPMPPKTRAVPASIRHTNILLSCILHEERTSTLGGGWKAAAAFLKYRARPIGRLPPSDALLKASPDRTDPPTAGLELQSRIPELTRILKVLRARGARNDPMTYALRAQYDGVIRLDPETARKVLQNAGLPLGEYHYAALMTGLVECGHMDSATAVMTAAQDAGFGSKEAIMHTILVSGYGRMGQPREAERVFKDMVEAGIKPDAISVDALAGAWFISGDYNRAREVVIERWPAMGEPPCGRDAGLKQLVHELRKLRPAAKVRQKRTEDATKRDLHFIDQIIGTMKAPDRVLPLSTGERRDFNKSRSRSFSSAAGAGSGSSPANIRNDVHVEGGAIDQPAFWERRLESQVRVLSMLR